MGKKDINFKSSKSISIILKQLCVKKEIADNPRVTIALTDIFNRDMWPSKVLTQMEIRNFEKYNVINKLGYIAKDYYGLRIDKNTGNCRLQHLYYYDDGNSNNIPQEEVKTIEKCLSVISTKKCNKKLEETTFSTDESGNVIEKREYYEITPESPLPKDLNKYDGNSSKRLKDDLKQIRTITYNKYGIEIKYELIEYRNEKGKLILDRQETIIRNSDYPYIATVIYGDGKSEYRVLDKSDFAVLVLSEEKFQSLEEIEQYYETHKEEIKKAFSSRGKCKYRRSKIYAGKSVEEVQETFENYEPLKEKGNEGLKEMAQKAGILPKIFENINRRNRKKNSELGPNR